MKQSFVGCIKILVSIPRFRFGLLQVSKVLVSDNACLLHSLVLVVRARFELATNGLKDVVVE
jgi:hypothetical protein